MEETQHWGKVGQLIRDEGRSDRGRNVREGCSVVAGAGGSGRASEEERQGHETSWAKRYV